MRTLLIILAVILGLMILLTTLGGSLHRGQETFYDGNADSSLNQYKDVQAASTVPGNPSASDFNKDVETVHASATHDNVVLAENSPISEHYYEGPDGQATTTAESVSTTQPILNSAPLLQNSDMMIEPFENADIVYAEV